MPAASLGDDGIRKLDPVGPAGRGDALDQGPFQPPEDHDVPLRVVGHGVVQEIAFLGQFANRLAELPQDCLRRAFFRAEWRG